MQIRRSTGLLVLSLMTAFFLAACGGGGGGDSAPPPPDLSPSATTLPADPPTSNSAVLKAIVNPKGLSTQAWFEYSKDPAFPTNGTTSTPSQALGSGSADITISESISGLESGQRYHFRVTAISSAGTKKGATVILNTLPLPSVTTNQATPITTTGAVLNADVNPNGLSTTAVFVWGTDPTLTTGTTTTPSQNLGSVTVNVPVSTTLSGLNVATKYYYRVVATNSSGTSNGTILNFTTAGGVPLVTTKSATSVTAHEAVLNADVNPSALSTWAWFEYGTTPSFGNVIDNVNRGNGTSTVSINKLLPGLLLNTQYWYRIVANNSIGTSYGDPFPFTTLNPTPTANAGPDQTVYMAGPGTTLGFLGETLFDLAGSGTIDPGKTITSYLWEQIAGTTVAYDNYASPTPTIVAPALSYGASEDLQFKLTVTDNTGLTGTDNVLVTVKWGFLDDFSFDSTGTYNSNPLGTTGTFIYDAAGERGRVVAGSGQSIIFSKELKIVLPGPDVQLYTNTGVFSLVFYPTGSNGNISIRLVDTPTTYYEFSTQDDILRKVRSGGVVDSAPFTNSYSQGGTYPIKITFSPTLTTVEAFGGTASLTTDESSNSVIYFEIRADQQNGYFDNIKLEAAP